jgi:alanyl-tRNA synthetase
LVDSHNNNKSKSIAFIFSIQDTDKLSIGVGVTEDLIKGFDASDFAKKLSLSLNGKGGGGRKDFAQSGGSNTSLDDIDKAVDEIISKI